MYIHHEDIIIRDAVESDSQQLADWWNDGRVMAHAGFPLGLGITPQEIAISLSTDSDDTRRRLIIEHQKKPIGEMNFRNRGNRTAEIGIKICDPSYQEKGLGRTVLSLLIDELFRRGYARITLDTNLNNTRAQHVYELLGFRKLRVNHYSWTDQLGQLQSSVDYELTADDFHNYAE